MAKDFAEQVFAAAKELAAKRGITDLDYFFLGRASRMLPEQPIEQAAKNVLSNIKYIEMFEKQKPRQIGKFTFKVSRDDIQVDCPIQFEVTDTKNNRIATFGFFTQKTPKGKEMQITNIQGVEGEALSLKELSKTLKENYRVWIAKDLKKFADKRKMKTVGVLPEYFGFYWASYFEYQRVLRQCKQTFRKAGITNVDARRVEPPSERDLMLSRQRRTALRKEKAEQKAKTKRRPHGK